MSEKIPVVLVTGVGPGAGAAISRRFALGGYRVAMLARTSERLEALQRELPHAKRYPCDVTDETQLDSVIEAVRRDLGAPKVLVHNALGGSLGNFMEIDPKVPNSNFQVNTTALLYLARRLALAMVEAGEGAIVVPAIPQPCGENLASRDSLPPRRRNGSSPNLSPENWDRRASMSPTLIDAVVDLEWTRTMTSKPAGDPFFIQPSAIAEEIWHVVHQDRSAWSFNVEIRPFQETW
jgi:short subunit dehydrogenase